MTEFQLTFKKLIGRDFNAKNEVDLLMSLMWTEAIRSERRVDKVSGYTKKEHEEAAGMPLAPAFMRQVSCSCVPCKHYKTSLYKVPCKYCRNHSQFEEKS